MAKNHSRVFLSQLFNRDASQVLFRHIIIVRGLINVADPYISEEFTSVFVLVENLLEIIHNFLHGLVIWGDTSSNKAIWMWVSIKYVHPTFLNTIQQHLRKIESCGAAPDNGKPELFV